MSKKEFYEKQKTVKRNYKISNIVTAIIMILYFIFFGVVVSLDTISYNNPILSVILIWVTFFIFVWLVFVWGYFYCRVLDYKVD